ncbi:DUF5602 domain-containing protein [Bdellovibrio sp. HCB2-146]|uniref:DUF5602 domain-containing protein n=1 Tax=Bdellovibrio sp. HCB2-146 TaxID=3394362 RepID=UPI0039BD653D
MRFNLWFFSICFLCALSAKGNSISKGAEVRVGAGVAYSFVEFDNQNMPLSIGMEFNGKALSGLPAHDREFTLPFPAGTILAPYNHLTMNWNPHGHFPDEVYGVSHFDFHFYFITEKARQKIRCSDNNNDPCTRLPLEEYTPPFYVPAPEGVSNMGWHWVDSRSPELNGKAFTTTFIYGYYRSEFIFVEPMMSHSFLLTKPQFESDIETPPKIKLTGYYPRSYSLKYDSVRDLYSLRLQKLQLRATSDF